MKQKCFALFSILIICFLTACQSTPQTSSSDSGRMYISADTGRREGLPFPLTELNSGQVPQAIILGFGGRSIALELWKQDGPLLGRANFVVPEERTKREDKGIVYAQGFENMRPVRRIETQHIPAGMCIQLKPLPPGAYEVRLVLDEKVRQTAAFRVGP
jgi:hypothetical protein